MKTLSIDIETYSDEPLQKTGVYRYVESPNFEILLFAYSVDSQPVQVIDLACGEQIPKEVLLALEDETVIKWTFNIINAFIIHLPTPFPIRLTANPVEAMRKHHFQLHNAESPYFVLTHLMQKLQTLDIFLPQNVCVGTHSYV